MLHWGGRCVNAGSSALDPVPFIGVVVQEARDVLRTALPAMLIQGELHPTGGRVHVTSWEHGITDRLPEVRDALGVTDEVGFYFVLAYN